MADDRPDKSAIINQQSEMERFAMSTAYKCDLTEKIIEGQGTKRIVVDLGNLRLTVIPSRRGENKQFGEGDLSPAAVEQIKAALLALKPKA
jgi:hypothetical protein